MTQVKKVLGVAAVAAALLVLGSSASAQPTHLQPGSVLIYPVYDSTPGAGTVICVTNTNDSKIYCPDSDFREGDVVLHYVYVDGETCFEFDRFEFLTPGDTLCVLADLHNPEQDQGFLMVAAVDPQDYDRYIKFDYLIGSSIVVQSDLNFLWAYTPYPFIGRPDVVNGTTCDPESTDQFGDGDGAVDFDGIEYALFPEELFIASFFQETGVFGNQLALLTTTGQDYIAELNFWFWNNIEQKFSKTFKFTCWFAGALSEISAVVTDLNGDDGELGHGTVETGWANIVPNRVLDLAGNPIQAEGGGNLRPPILGVLAQFITASDFASGHALHFTGSLDGLEIINGDGDVIQ